KARENTPLDGLRPNGQILHKNQPDIPEPPAQCTFQNKNTPTKTALTIPKIKRRCFLPTHISSQ
ncbi:hypothetical protein, partial [Phyllobacterium myrsinacearum]|uniref:hypothetical protein n=1 Tax=Phyllobacterium myrsinacearum TaxID=28101 RepID=UPI001AED384B